MSLDQPFSHFCMRCTWKAKVRGNWMSNGSGGAGNGNPGICICYIGLVMEHLIMHAFTWRDIPQDT